MERKSRILVGIDRDNTINYDEKGYFGSKDDWMEQFRFCPGAVKGLEMLSQYPNIANVVLTNQVGIAKGVLTCERVEEINKYINGLLSQSGVFIDSWQYNPFCLDDEAKSWEKRGVTTVNYTFVLDKSDPRTSWMKPGIGLLEKAAAELGLKLESQKIYVVGDRSSDVLTGVNAGGIGILVNNPEVERGTSIYDSIKEIEEKSGQPQYNGRIYVVKNLVEAAEIILGSAKQ